MGFVLFVALYLFGVQILALILLLLHFQLNQSQQTRYQFYKSRRRLW